LLSIHSRYGPLGCSLPCADSFLAGFNGSVTLPAAAIATGADRWFPGQVFHLLDYYSFHDAQRNVLLPVGGGSRRKGVQMDERFEKDGEGGTGRGRSPSGGVDEDVVKVRVTCRSERPGPLASELGRG